MPILPMREKGHYERNWQDGQHEGMDKECEFSSGRNFLLDRGELLRRSIGISGLGQLTTEDTESTEERIP